jgi:DNA end-binding protein Ku
MPRAIWTGSLGFGLVNVPVKLYTATEDRDISFHQLAADTGERIRYKRVGEESGKEIAYQDIVKGYEVESGRYVLVTPEELEGVEPGRSRTIEIEDFVDLDDVDPVYFQKTYYIAPADKEGASKPYALLRETMEEAGKVGIARFVLRNKQHLAAVRPRSDVLVLETMYFADEVRIPSKIDELDPKAAPSISAREKAAAKQLVQALSSEWDPERYEDTYRTRVLELIEAKAGGEEVVTQPEVAEPTNVVDLMKVLEASVNQAKQRRTEGGSGGGGGGKDRGRRRDKASGGRGGSSGPDVDELSKEELYEEAQKRDIAGRSKMSKEELAEAVKEEAS